MRLIFPFAVLGLIAITGSASISDARGEDVKSKDAAKSEAGEKPRKSFQQQEAEESARNEKRSKIGDYLADEDPVYSFVRELGRIAHRDSPNHTHLERLTPTAQNVFNVFHFQADVINGGFGGYYGNSAGNTAHETLAALREIGAPLSAAILAKSLTAFSKGRAPTDRVERYDLMEDNPDRYYPLFAELSDHFHGRVVDEVDESLHKLLTKYMKRRRDEPYKSAPDQPMPDGANMKTPPPLPGEAGQLTREKLLGPSPDTTAVEFTKAFVVDRDAAFEKYEATRGLTVSGTVKTAGRDPEDKLIVELTGDGKQTVRCFGFENEAGVEGKVRVGATVKIRGLWKMDYSNSKLYLRHAVLVE